MAEGEVERARAMQHRAEAWKARASAFSYFMLGLLYAAGTWFLWKIGTLIYKELSRW